jgi:EpsI family protein
MIIKRLAGLQLILLVGLSAVFLVPKDIKMQPAAVDLALPIMVGDWKGEDEAATQGERDILGPDTQFAKRRYVNGTDEISVSIVLSGPDMNTSIHRPERCLPAQGWTISDSRIVALPTEKGTLRTTRLHNSRNVRTDRGQPLRINNLSYYWFIGHSNITPSHLERTWIDIRDRVLKGTNQQWAYVTVAASITKDYKIFGRSEKETDQLIRDFIRELAPQLQKASLTSAR